MAPDSIGPPESAQLTGGCEVYGAAMTLDTSEWGELRLIEQIDEGNRNEVWCGVLDGRTVAVRQSRRSPASLDWEVDLLADLATHGVLVPTVVATDADDRYSADRVVVQEWIDGRVPTSVSDWDLVAAELRRLHHLTVGHPQRPTCCTVGELAASGVSVDADMSAVPESARAVLLDVFAGFADDSVAVVHGDPGPSNLRITDDGRVGLLDWDESRVDVTLHDLSNLGHRVLPEHEHRRAQRLSDAWEAANAWVAEPEYAQMRFHQLSSGAGRPSGTQ